MLDPKETYISFVNGDSEIIPEIINDRTFEVQPKTNQKLNICDSTGKIPDRILSGSKGFVFKPTNISTINSNY
ncbi:MAG TPA: hypothetical protein VEW65_05280 [Chryseolinea sp.]|nr:hypothetical protein [Chryseolinea sp.]